MHVLGIVKWCIMCGYPLINLLNGMNSSPWIYVVASEYFRHVGRWEDGRFPGVCYLEQPYGFSGKRGIKEFARKSGQQLRK